MVLEWSAQAFAGRSICAAMMFMANTNRSKNMAMTPAWPGILVRFLDSSLRLVAVSQPQKKKPPSTSPADKAVKPPIDAGLSHDQWKLVEPAGWLTATLMVPHREKPITATDSMIRSNH